MIRSAFFARFSRFFRPRPLATSLAACVLLGVGACVHRIDIQQGNFLDQEDVARVSVGMTRIQVRALLGTPMVADPFHDSRWDYVYYLKKGRWRKPEFRHFIVHFDAGDKVERIDWPTGAPVRPGSSEADEAVTGNEKPVVPPKSPSELFSKAPPQSLPESLAMGSPSWLSDHGNLRLRSALAGPSDAPGADGGSGG